MHCTYVHCACAAYSLNLAKSNSCKVVSIRNIIGTVSTVATFFRAFSQRSNILIENIKNILQIVADNFDTNV